MSTNRLDERVYRAEFRDRIVTSFGQERIEKGNFVVQVARSPINPRHWVVVVVQACPLMLTVTTSAPRAKRLARGYFGGALCDWVEGRIADGQWRPVDETCEQDLRRGA